jgi:hypothetical protein
VLSVTIEHNDGRYKASAKLFLEIPELLDEWPESRQNAFVKNKEVNFRHRFVKEQVFAIAPSKN